MTLRFPGLTPLGYILTPLRGTPLGYILTPLRG